MKKFSFLLFVVALSFSGVAPVQADNRVWAFDCEFAFPPPIDAFYMACGDGNEGVYKIKWSKWGATGAVGIGVYGKNNCDPDCADGTFHFFRAKVVLSKPLTIKGRKYLSYIKWWQIDSKGRDVKNGLAGEWDLYGYFKQAGGKL